MLTWADTDWEDTSFSRSFANLILRNLVVADRAKLEPHLQEVRVTRGAILIEKSAATEHVYFPQGPLISLEQVPRMEVALVGSEGFVGWPAMAGCRRSPYRAVIRGGDGLILKVRTEALLRIAAQVVPLAAMLNQFATVVSVQMAETISAHASHRIDTRLSRWLLLRHDRVSGDELIAHHEEIADNLGTRRASITDCFHILEGNGLVRCRRGRITIRNRRGLETLAAACYGAAEGHYREIIGEFGKRVDPPLSPPPGPGCQSSDIELVSESVGA